MIRKAVFSYFNPDESFGNKCGFARYSDFLYSTALSVHCASRLFPEVQFISSSWGVDIMSQLDLPVTSYSNKLDEMKTAGVSKYFWAYGKLIAYCEQTKPFVHIDNDVFLWEALPKRILNAKLCFQSHEPFDSVGYKYYNILKECWVNAPVKPKAIEDNEVTDYAYNCGICGGNYLPFFKEWKATSEEYIFAPENQHVFFDMYRNILIHQNLFHEQYFLSCLVKKHGWRKKVQVLDVNAMNISRKLKYTHIWGTTKKQRDVSARVRMQLFDRDEELFLRISRFCKKHDI